MHVRCHCHGHSVSIATIPPSTLSALGGKFILSVLDKARALPLPAYQTNFIKLETMLEPYPSVYLSHVRIF